MLLVASPRIELGYQVPETCVLSIVLRGRDDQPYGLFDQSLSIAGKNLYRNGEQNYAKKFSDSN